MIAAVVEPVGRNANWSLYCSDYISRGNNIRYVVYYTTYLILFPEIISDM